MIKFKRLELSNFLSHKNTVLDLSGYNGLILIEGKTLEGHYSSNGAGKSTILEGVYYALTGDTLRGLSVNDIINRNYKKNARVTLSFEVNNESYRIDRYRKDDIHGDSIVLMHNEEDISKRLNRDTQTLIDNLLGISKQILASTILLGEGLSARFTQLSDPDKKSLIESTLNLQYDLNKSRDASKSELKDLKMDSSRLEGELSVLQNLSDLNKEDLEKRIVELDSKIALLSDRSENISQEMKDLSEEKDNIQPKISLLRESMNKYDKIIADIARADKEMVDLYAMQSSVRDQSDILCPVCHQPLSNEDSRNATIQHYQDRISELLTTTESLNNEKNELPDYQIMNDKIIELNNRFQEINNNFVELSELSKQCLSEQVRYNNEIDHIKKEIISLISRDEDIENKNKEMMSIQKSIDKYEYFSDLFSPTGIIVSILDEAISYINTRLATYSEVLLEKDYKITFNKGKINLIDSKGSNYQSLSNGEKRRLDIAIQFSLHDYVTMYCGMRSDTCFIDEILDTLDDIGVENIFDVLRLKMDYCGLKSIYVISHNSSLKSKFDNFITIMKDDQGDSSVI